jgi:hypothetical protein
MGKRKGPRKAYLKRFAADNIHIRPRRQPGKGLAWQHHVNKMEFAENTKRGELPQFSEDGYYVGEMWYAGKNPRLAVLDNIEAQQKEAEASFLERMLKWLNVALLKTKKQELRLYFDGCQYVLVEMDLFLNKFKRSIIYTNKDKAIRAYKMKAVVWVSDNVK